MSRQHPNRTRSTSRFSFRPVFFIIFIISFSRELTKVSPGASSVILSKPVLSQHWRFTLKYPDVGLLGLGKRPTDAPEADHFATRGCSVGEDAGRGILVLGRGVFELLELSDFMDWRRFPVDWSGKELCKEGALRTVERDCCVG
jgi:hypothetical protein